jgi:hypothetical protein
MDLATVKALLELGWPAIITVMFGYLAIQYIADQRRQIATLWERVTSLETELIKVKTALLEAHLLANGTDKPKPLG